MTDIVGKTLHARIVAAGVKNVYIGDAPSLQLNCVSLRPVDGYPSSRYFGKGLMSEPLVEVIIRNRYYEAGQGIYNTVKETLDKFSDESSGILSCFLTGSPGYLGRDVEGFSEWHMIFHVTVKE